MNTPCYLNRIQQRFFENSKYLCTNDKPVPLGKTDCPITDYFSPSRKRAEQSLVDHLTSVSIPIALDDHYWQQLKLGHLHDEALAEP